MEGVGVERWTEIAVEQRHQLLTEEHAACHPLVVVAAAVGVRAIELALRKACHQPLEDLRVSGVHAERHVGLSAVAAEVSFPDEEADQEADIEVRQVQWT
jgi:hypothetical protein